MMQNPKSAIRNNIAGPLFATDIIVEGHEEKENGNNEQFLSFVMECDDYDPEVSNISNSSTKEKLTENYKYISQELVNYGGKAKTKGSSNVKDVTKSSPCSPTFVEECESKSSKRQRSYSDSGDQLTAQDKACLEEIERGSKLIPEDQELFDYLSKNKLELSVSGQSKVNRNLNGRKNDTFNNVATCTSNTTSFKSTVPLKTSSLNTSSGVQLTKNSVDLNTVDTLESVLIQSCIPVTLSNRNKPQKSKIVNCKTKTHKPEKASMKSKYQIIESVSDSLNSSKILLDNKMDSHSISPKESLNVQEFSVVTNPTPQTIQKVVVHIDGKEQVFDVPQIEGEQLTIQPITMVPSSTSPEVGLASFVLPAGVTLQDGNCFFLPTEQQTVTGDDPTDKNKNMKKVSIKVQGNTESTTLDVQQKPYMCEECGMAYAKPSKLKLHVMSKHTGCRPFKCTYPGCDWAFTAKYKLQRHIECHENKKKGIKEFKCPIDGCEKSCTTIYNLNTHMKLHKRPLSEKCEVCGEQFGTLKALAKHMNTHGEKYKTVKCPYEGCTKMFYSKVTMGSHLLSHQRSSHFPCTFAGCTKVFNQKCKLEAHKRCHTKERPYKCPHQNCHWSFSNSSHLRRHMKAHTNERNYECEQCGKKFLRPEHLKGHLVSHTGEKPFKCEFPGCNAKFSARSTMYIHLRKHKRLDINMSSCPIEGCKEMFQGKAELRKHIDQHYGLDAKVEKVIAKDIELDASGLQFINFNLANSAGSVNQIIVTPELAQSLLAASAGSMVETGAATSVESFQPITIPFTFTDDSDSVLTTETTGGSARTDYHSNHLLSIRAKKRRQILKQKAAQAGFDLVSIQDIAETSTMVHRFEEDNDNTSGPVMNPNEVMTSRAITIRDPETGAIYVQTQLLQDDPPNLEFEDSVLDCGSDSNFGNEIAGLIHDANLADANTSSANDFPGSVINLPDLECT